MKFVYVGIVGLIVVVLGLLFFPTVHINFWNINTTGFLPITSAAAALMPYVFLAFIVYAIFLLVKS